MKVTKAWIKKWNPCKEAIEWAINNKLYDDKDILKQLKKEKKLEWANWFIVRRMKYKQYVSYAVYAAEQVLDIYEKKYPDDKRPREAIEAAKKCIKNKTKKNIAAAAAAAYAAAYAAAAATADTTADTAAYAADAADTAAYAADAVDTAAYAADAAAAAAYAAATAAADVAAYVDATAAADVAAYVDAKQKLKLKILNYGIKLLNTG